MYLKKLREQRSELVEKMKKLLSVAEKEERAMTEDEEKEFSETEEEIQKIDKSIAAAEKAAELKETEEDNPKGEDGGSADGENRATDEKREFANFIRGVITGEQRAEENMTFGENGAIIPKTIAQEIIKKIKDISPLYKDASHYNVKGTLSIPYVDEEGTSLTVAYADEFVDLEGKKETFKSVELTGFLAGVLAKISKSLVNNSDFDVVEEVENQMAEAIALWLDKELLIGTDGKIEGISKYTQKVTAESATALVFDDIIKLKDKLKAVLQSGACFVMHETTLTAIRLLKDGNGHYLVNDDVTKEGAPTILSCPVHTSDAMPEIGAGKTVIYYVNPNKALGVKLTEDMEIQVLKEKYATQHVIGVVGWMEVDAKIKNQQAVAGLAMAD